MSSPSPTPPIPADVQHFPAIPSYVVALSVVAGVVVSALVIFILYTCLVQRSKKRVLSNVQESPNMEIEKLREEPAVEHDDHLSDSTVTEATVAGHIKPKPSPSIFSRGDFLMEVLEGVENSTDLSIDGDVENTTHICEADRVTVAMDDLAQDDDHSAAPIPPSSPPMQSGSMDLFLADLSLTHSGSLGGGLRVREGGQADASTAQLRGSFSSEEGGQVIICRDIEIYEDPVVSEVHEDLVVSEINEDPILSEIYEDCVVGEILEDMVELAVKEVEVGVECLEDDIDDLINDDIKVKYSSDKNKLAATIIEDVLNLAIGFQETISEGEDVGDIVIEKCNEEDDQDDNSSSTLPQASPCLPELILTPPAPTIPLNIIPVSNQKLPTIPNTLSHSTPTPSLLHPLVSMHALPLADRALSVSHLSLNRSGKHLPATPLSCNSEYSPVYNMQFGSSRRLATDETTINVGKEREEVAELSPDDASEVNQELKLQ